MKTMMTIHKAALALTAVLPLAACGAGGPQPGFAPALPLPPMVQTPQNGAIFQAANGYAGYHEGTRARRVVYAGFLLAVALSIWLATPRIALASGAACAAPAIMPRRATPNSVAMAVANVRRDRRARLMRVVT